jgi:hypothetical protein
LRGCSVEDVIKEGFIFSMRLVGTQAAAGDVFWWAVSSSYVRIG